MNPKLLALLTEFGGSIDFGTNDDNIPYVAFSLFTYHKVLAKHGESLEDLLTRAGNGALAAYETELEDV